MKEAKKKDEIIQSLNIELEAIKMESTSDKNQQENIQELMHQNEVFVLCI